MKYLILFAFLFPGLVLAKKPSIPYVGEGASETVSPSLAIIQGYVKMPLLGRPISVIITCLDGVSPERKNFVSAYRNGHRYPDKAHVTPGRHYLTAEYNIGPFSGSSSFWLDTKADTTYNIKVKDHGLSATIWLENAKDSSVVGGPIKDAPDPKPGNKACPMP